MKAVSPAELPERGLSHIPRSGGEDGDLICCGRRDNAHTQEGKLGQRGSQEPILTRSTSAMIFLLSEKASAVLHRVQPSREDAPNETAAFLFLPQTSLGLSGKGRVRANSVVVSFYQKQQR